MKSSPQETLMWWWKGLGINMKTLINEKEELEQLTEEEQGAIKVMIGLADKKIEMYSKKHE